MDDPNDARPDAPSQGGALPYPANKVMGAVAMANLGEAVTDLCMAGFAPVGAIAGEAGLRRLRETSSSGGVGGALRTFGLSMGGDLDHLRQAEQELVAGHALVDVEVDGEAGKALARDVLLRHGGHFIVYFDRWTIETLA